MWSGDHYDNEEVSNDGRQGRKPHGNPQGPIAHQVFAGVERVRGRMTLNLNLNVNKGRELNWYEIIHSYVQCIGMKIKLLILVYKCFFKDICCWSKSTSTIYDLFKGTLKIVTINSFLTYFCQTVVHLIKKQVLMYKNAK